MPPPHVAAQEVYRLGLLKLPDAAQSHSEQPAHTRWCVLLFPAVLLLQSNTGEPVLLPGRLGGSILKKHPRQVHYNEALKSCTYAKAEQSQLPS